MTCNSFNVQGATRGGDAIHHEELHLSRLTGCAVRPFASGRGRYPRPWPGRFRCSKTILADVRRESNSPDRAAMTSNRSSPRRSCGSQTSCGGRRRCLRRKKQKTQHARNRALHCAVLTLHHGSVTLHIHHQQRVRVAAERLVARTRSESSSSALKVLKLSWLAHQSLGSHSTPPSCCSSWLYPW